MVVTILKIELFLTIFEDMASLYGYSSHFVDYYVTLKGVENEDNIESIIHEGSVEKVTEEDLEVIEDYDILSLNTLPHEILVKILMHIPPPR